MPHPKTDSRAKIKTQWLLNDTYESTKKPFFETKLASFRRISVEKPLHFLSDFFFLAEMWYIRGNMGFASVVASDFYGPPLILLTIVGWRSKPTTTVTDLVLYP